MRRSLVLAVLGFLVLARASSARAGGAVGPAAAAGGDADPGAAPNDSDEPDEPDGPDSPDSPDDAARTASADPTAGDEDTAATRDDSSTPGEADLQETGDEPPFNPHWQAGLQYSRESEQGGGYASEFWTASMTRAMSDAGSALGIAFGAGHTLVDGAFRPSWDLGVTGTLGFDRASPSLETNIGGSGSFEQHAGTTVGLDLPLLDGVALSLSAGAEARARQDVFESVLGDTDGPAVVHGSSLQTGVGLSLEPLGWLSVSPSYEHAWSEAVAERPLHSGAAPLRERSTTDLFGLSVEVRVSPFAFELGGQLGRDRLPADAPINPRTGAPTRPGGASALRVGSLSLSAKVDL